MRSEELDAVLASVRGRIARHRGQNIGEQNTKNVLIEPVLRALGWDVEDLDEVRREFKRKPSDNPVDYAFLLLRTPRLFLEAKALGENLDDDRWAKQIMGYAMHAGVEWVVLSDGNEYRIYNSHAKVPFEEKLFRQIKLASDDPAVAETLTLLSKSQLRDNQIEVLWRADFVDRQVKVAVEDLFATETPSDFVRLLRKRVPGLAPADVRASLGRAWVTIDYPVVQPPAATSMDTPASTVPTPPKATSGRKPKTPPAGDKTPWRSVTMEQLIASGTLRPPLDLETTYKGHRLTARVEVDGSVTWNGTTHKSLSLAGGMARKSIVGAPPGREYPQTNGWTFWRFRDSDGRLAFVDALRQRCFSEKPRI